MFGPLLPFVRVLLCVVLLLVPDHILAQQTLSPPPTVLPVVPNYTSGTPDLEEGIPPVKHPDGPKCDPGTRGCDLSSDPVGMARADAEGDNQLETFFWDGVTLVSYLWGGVGDLGIRADLLEQFRRFDVFESNHVLPPSLIGTTLRSRIDNVFRNVTMYEGFLGDSVFEKDSLDAAGPLLKGASGLFPLGYQYELREDVSEAMGESYENNNDDRGYKEYMPTHKYPVMVTGDTENPYQNDLTRPLFSDTLERQLRLRRPMPAADQRREVIGMFSIDSIATAYSSESTNNFQLCQYQVVNPIFRWVVPPFPFAWPTGSQPSGIWAGLMPIATVSCSDMTETHRPTYTEAVRSCIAKGGSIPTLEEMVLLKDSLPAGGAMNDAYITSDFGSANYWNVGQTRVFVYAPHVQTDNGYKGRVFPINIHKDRGMRDTDYYHGIKPNLKAVCLYN